MKPNDAAKSADPAIVDVEPYLFFDGRCEEALQFYQQALGAEMVMLMRFKESPEPANNPPGSDEKVMHASFRLGSRVLMASDGMCSGKPKIEGVSLSLTLQTPADADRFFAALSQGGQVNMPLGETFFSPKFGMVVDKFGVNWMVLVAAQPA